MNGQWIQDLCLDRASGNCLFPEGPVYYECPHVTKSTDKLKNCHYWGIPW